MNCCSLFRWHDHCTTKRIVSLVMGTVLLELKRCSLVPLLLLWRRMKHSLRFKSMLHICAYIVHDDKWEFASFIPSLFASTHINTQYQNLIENENFLHSFFFLYLFAFSFLSNGYCNTNVIGFCFQIFLELFLIQILLSLDLTMN